MFSFWAKILPRDYFVVKEFEIIRSQNLALLLGLLPNTVINAWLLGEELKNCWFSLFEIKLPAVDALPISYERALLFGSIWLRAIRKYQTPISVECVDWTCLLNETNRKPQQFWKKFKWLVLKSVLNKARLQIRMDLLWCIVFYSNYS